MCSNSHADGVVIKRILYHFNWFCQGCDLWHSGRISTFGPLAMWPVTNGFFNQFWQIFSKGAPGSKCRTRGWLVGSSSTVVKFFLEVCIIDWLNGFLESIYSYWTLKSAFLHYKISSTAEEYWYLHLWTPSYSDWVRLTACVYHITV